MCCALHKEYIVYIYIGLTFPEKANCAIPSQYLVYYRVRYFYCSSESSFGLEKKSFKDGGRASAVA